MDGKLILQLASLVVISNCNVLPSFYRSIDDATRNHKYIGSVAVGNQNSANYYYCSLKLPIFSCYLKAKV